MSYRHELELRLCIYCPKTVVTVTGPTTTGPGLTASVNKSVMTGDLVLEAGAMVRASGGILAMDEMDKSNPVVLTYMHQGMEQHAFSINKANIQTLIEAKTSVLAVANPK